MDFWLIIRYIAPNKYHIFVNENCNERDKVDSYFIIYLLFFDVEVK